MYSKLGHTHDDRYYTETEIDTKITALKTSFQDGCDKIVGKLTTLNYPPEEPKGPDEINTQIQRIYDERYNKGYTDGLANSDSTPSNAHIVYTYHSHTDDCKVEKTCAIDTKVTDCYGIEGGKYRIAYQIIHHAGPGCGKPMISSQYKDEGGAKAVGTTVRTYHTYKKVDCGWSEGEIEKAEIVFTKDDET